MFLRIELNFFAPHNKENYFYNKLNLIRINFAVTDASVERCLKSENKDYGVRNKT